MDEQEAGNNADSAELLDLLTPIVKSPRLVWPQSQRPGYSMLAGAGYTRDYPVEQCYRDNRLNPIHEGTHGIQSLDLLGRKLWQNNNRGLLRLAKKGATNLSATREEPALSHWVSHFESLLGSSETVSTLAALCKPENGARLGQQCTVSRHDG